ERYPILHKEYITPDGTLKVEVNKTDDWPYGDHVPFLDDYIAPRARKQLITGPADLPGLRYLLTPPSREIIADFHEMARSWQQFAQEHQLLTSGGAGVGGDMAGWLCGLQELIFLGMDAPDFVAELLQTIARWNLQRMEIVLDAGIELWVRRGWYESCDFWSPRSYRQFILPHLKQEVELAHSREVKFGYIMTSSMMPLLDMILEAGVDVLIGIDPLMGNTDIRAVKAKTNGQMCLWGGVNAPLTVEQGQPDEVRQAVWEALETLSPGGGFILAPVDDVEDPSPRAWNNAHHFIKAWQEWREGDDFVSAPKW
ncbi:MAG: uroporphyrinogen decarboxylase family protein, partial [Chloroflexota bacterium]